MKRVFWLSVATVLAVGCSNNGSSSSGGSSGESSSSSGGTSSGGSSGGSSGSSIAQACASPGTLVAGNNQGNTTGRPSAFACDDGNGSAGADAPEQVWRLVLSQPSGVRLTVTPESAFDTGIYIFSGADCATAMLAADTTCRDSKYEGEAESLEVAVLPAGTYWVVVDGYTDPDTGAASAGSYTLEAEIVAGGICVADGAEPNEDLENAAQAGPQRDDQGNLADVTLSMCTNDQDWFTFLNTGTQNVTVHAIKQGSGAGTLTAEILAITRPASGAATTTPVAGQNYNATTGDLTANIGPGEFAVHIGGSGQSEQGISYGFNILQPCEPDSYEYTSILGLFFLPTSNDSVEKRYFVDFRDPEFFNDQQGNPVPARLCPGDQDWMAVVHPGGDFAFNVTPVTGTSGTLTVELLEVLPGTGNTVTTQPVAGVTYTNSALTKAALPPGSYAIKITGSATPAGGTEYTMGTNIPCITPDSLEGALGNNTAVTANGPKDYAIADADAVSGALCPGDTDYLWLRNGSATGDLVVKLGGAAGMTVETLLATVGTDGKITGANGSAGFNGVTSGNDVTVTFTAAPANQNYLLKVTPGGTPPPAAGSAYTFAISARAPANETCATAQAVTLPAVGASTRISGNTGFADTAQTPENLDPSDQQCGSSTGPDVVYSFTTGGSAVSLTATILGLPSFDSIMYLRKGSCTAMDATCNDDQPNSVRESALTATLDASSTYYLIVDSYSRGHSFDLNLAVANP